MIKEVIDIFIYFKGKYRSFRNLNFFLEGAFRLFKTGSGICYKGIWYVLKSLICQIDVCNKYRKDNAVIIGFFPVVNKINTTDSSDPYASSLFYYTAGGDLYITTGETVKVIQNVKLLPTKVLKSSSQTGKKETSPNNEEETTNNLKTSLASIITPPGDPEAPVGPVEPGHPVDPIDPIDPVDPVDPEEPVLPLITLTETDKIVVVKTNGKYLILKYSCEFSEIRAVTFTTSWDIDSSYFTSLLDNNVKNNSIIKGDFTVSAEVVYFTYVQDSKLYVKRIDLDYDLNKLLLVKQAEFRLDPNFSENTGTVVWDENYNHDKSYMLMELLLIYSYPEVQSSLTPFRCMRYRVNGEFISEIILLEGEAYISAQNHFIAPICQGYSGFYLVNKLPLQLLEYTLNSGRDSVSLNKVYNIQNEKVLHFTQDLSIEDGNGVWQDIDGFYNRLL